MQLGRVNNLTKPFPSLAFKGWLQRVKFSFGKCRDIQKLSQVSLNRMVFRVKGNQPLNFGDDILCISIGLVDEESSFQPIEV